MLVIASREEFLLTLSRLATLALTPLFDGLKLGFCVVFLLVPTFRFIVPFKTLATLFCSICILSPSSCACCRRPLARARSFRLWPQVPTGAGPSL
jgi:hypothetical protein